MKSQNITYLPGVDHLRALAALWVVAYHGFHLLGYEARFHAPFTMANWLTSSNPLAAIVLEGHTAVALFMVLSGFIFTTGTWGRKIAYGPFLKNRLLRLAPLYVFLLFVGLAAAPSVFSMGGMFQWLLPLGNMSGAMGIQPYTNMFWAVAIEFQFYLIFPFLLVFLARDGWRVLWGLLLLVVMYRFIAIGLGAQPRDLSYMTILGRADQFLLGMMAGRLFKEGFGPRFKSLPINSLTILTLCVALAMAGSLVWLHSQGGWVNTAWWKILWPLWEAVCWSGFVFAYVSLFKDAGSPVSRVLCWLGERSYSIYLQHMVVIFVVLKMSWVFSGDNLMLVLAMTTALIVMPITVLMSALSYAVIERPFLGLRRSYLH
jgi:peptidoglycan/LPS O-acetylase OafA/YrhL